MRHVGDVNRPGGGRALAGASRGRVASRRVPRRPVPVVVTDLREPLVLLHRRLMRRRAVLFLVWTAGWIVSGLLWRHGYLATVVLMVSGPGVWLAVWAWEQTRRPGRREPAAPRRRAIAPVTPEERAGPGAGATR